MNTPYQLKRSKRRKTLSIQIKKAQLIVLAPTWLPIADIEVVLLEKRTWIEAKMIEQIHLLNVTPSDDLNQVSTLMLFNQTVEIERCFASKSHYKFDAHKFRLTLVLSRRVHTCNQLHYLQSLVQVFYSEQLTDYLQTRLPLLANNMSLTYQTWQVKNYKAKWGSCNSRGELAFNWRLATMPFEVIDSVIIHELCHLVHLNHSAAFWQLVSRYDPQYQEHKKYLTQHGHQLSF